MADNVQSGLLAPDAKVILTNEPPGSDEAQDPFEERFGALSNLSPFLKRVINNEARQMAMHSTLASAIDVDAPIRIGKPKVPFHVEMTTFDMFHQWLDTQCQRLHAPGESTPALMHLFRLYNFAVENEIGHLANFVINEVHQGLVEERWKLDQTSLEYLFGTGRQKDSDMYGMIAAYMALENTVQQLNETPGPPGLLRRLIEAINLYCRSPKPQYSFQHLNLCKLYHEQSEHACCYADGKCLIRQMLPVRGASSAGRKRKRADCSEGQDGTLRFG